jgi:hypothetical protein
LVADRIQSAKHSPRLCQNDTAINNLLGLIAADEDLSSQQILRRYGVPSFLIDSAG